MARGGKMNPWILGIIFLASAIGVAFVLIQVSKQDVSEQPVQSAADPVMLEVAKLKGQIQAYEENGRLKDETIKSLKDDFQNLKAEMKEIETETDLFQQHLAKAARAPVIQFPEKMKHFHYYPPKPSVKKPVAKAETPPATQKREPSKAPVGIVKKIKKQLKALEK